MVRHAIQKLEQKGRAHANSSLPRLVTVCVYALSPEERLLDDRPAAIRRRGGYLLRRVDAISLRLRERTAVTLRNAVLPPQLQVLSPTGTVVGYAAIERLASAGRPRRLEIDEADLLLQEPHGCRAR